MPCHLSGLEPLDLARIGFDVFISLLGKRTALCVCPILKAGLSFSIT